MHLKKIVSFVAIAIFGAGCGGSCPGPDPTSNSGNVCHLEVDPPFLGWNGAEQAVAGATIECVQVADEIDLHVVLEYETWIDWDELSVTNSSDFNVATHTDFAEWGCKDRGNHNFKTVANGWVVDDAGTSLWGVSTQNSKSVTLACNPPDRP